MTTSTAPATLTGTYRLDPAHSRVGFVARHAMVSKVRGSFNELTGTATFDVENPPSSSLQLTIEAASIDTRNPDRDAHLRSNDFLDLEHYPQITFTSTAVAQVEPDTYRLTGDLTIKGVTRPVTFDLAYTGSA
ncbi:MAG: YceI family protein, partial [Acidimicrobiales bacterium]